jgi:hypothetical protein
VETHGPWVFDSNTPRGATLGQPKVPRSVLSTGAPTSIVFRAGSADVFSMSAAVAPATADIVFASASGGISATARTNLADAVVGKITITANPALPVSVVTATALTLTLSASSGTNGVPITVTITPNGPIPSGGLSVTLAASNGGVLGSTSLSFTSGSTAAQTTTLTRSTTGSSTVTMTNSAGLTNAGSGATFTSVAVGTFAWAFSDSATVTRGRNTTTTVATDVPSGATFYASPDLLPGETLALNGTTLQIVGDATVPTVDGSASGSVLDIISARDISIEVLDSPALATIVNVTQGITYAPGADYTGRVSDPGYGVNRWNAVMTEANPNDVIEISPGYVQGSNADMANYYSANLNSAMLAVWKPVTIRNMVGRGRWRLFNGADYLSTGRSGIVIFSPGDIGQRGSFVVEGFEVDNFGTDGFGLRARTDNKSPGVYTYMHAAVTVRNFKIGRPTGFRSLSGISATSELLTMEDGHVYDTGSSSGLNHNLYCGAKTMTLRGLRLERTRGWTGTPWAGGTCDLDGHLAKLQAADATVEGCAFVCGPTSGPSQLLQMYAGGNWAVRGCTFVDTPFPNNANGAITMSREYQISGTPNFDWFAGMNGNSLTFERNVWVGHYPRPILWFFTTAGYPLEALYPPDDTGVTAQQRLSALTVWDNIAMVTSASAPYMLSGFPGTSDAMWINNSPDPAQGNWGVRNTKHAYSRNAAAFGSQELLMHTDLAGAPAAWGGSQAVPQFLWPHGTVSVTRATQGLG